MFGDWQILTSLIITALAALYVGYRFWGSTLGGGCNSCSRCSESINDRMPRIVPLVDASSLVSSVPSKPNAEDA